VRRLPIQIDDEMYQLLKARAFREGRSIADLIRESIALNSRNAPPRSIEVFSFVGSGSSPADRKERTSERHDRALANAFAARMRKRK
jgi:predicted CopG family antitoxin